MKVPEGLARWANRLGPGLLAFTVVAFAFGSSTVDLLQLVGWKLRWVSLLALAGASVVLALDSRRRARELRAPAALALAFLGVAFASVAWSVAPRLTFTRAASLTILFAVVAALARASAERPELASRLLRALLSGAAIVAAAGLLVLAIVHGDAVQAASPQYGARYQGLGLNPNTMAGLFAVALPVAAWQAWEQRGLRRLAAALVFLLLEGSIVASASRGAIFASLVALLAFAVSSGASARVRSALVVGVVALGVAGIGISQIPKAAPSGASERPGPVTRDAQSTLPLDGEIGRGDPGSDAPPIRRRLLGGSGRSIAWRGALRQTADRPLGGYGFGTEEKVFVDRFYYFYSNVPENSYLGLGLQVGIAGVAAFGALALSLLLGAARGLRRLRPEARRRSAAAASVFVGGLVLALTQSYLTSVGNVATISVWLGAALALAASVRPVAPADAFSGDAPAGGMVQAQRAEIEPGSATGAAAAPGGERRPPVRPALLCGLAAGAFLVAISAPFLGRYGWERDELYFVSASRRPALGYVDFPPVTAWVGWAVREVAGDSRIGLRLTGLACATLSAILVALMARELGGGRRAQLGAAVAWVVTPFLLASGSIYYTGWFDLLAWVAFLYVALRVLGRPEPRLWPLLGVVAGVGLLTKYTILALLGAFLVALVASGERRLLRSRGPLIGAAIALLLFAPNLVWQARHGWPSLRFAKSQAAFTAGATSRPDYVAQQLLFLGAALALAVVGTVWLWRRPRLRPLAAVPVIVTLLFLFERGQGAYPLPADALPLAAGAVALERWSASRRVRRSAAAGLVALHAFVLALLLPHVLPVRTTASMVRSGTWRATGWRPTFYQEEIGWPELARATMRVWRSLPRAESAPQVVLASNYGEASALDLYWRSPDRPLVLSGYLSWQYWRPAHLRQRSALVVGYPPAFLTRLCSSWRRRGRIENRWRLPNLERGRLIASCRLRAPLEELWKPLIATSRL